MILHALELTHVGPFRQPVKVGPFAPGLNILAAANETGKSTALKAAARALFDRHTTKSEELKALQPAGTDLAPRIAVEFSTAAGRFRLEKTFLQSPRSLLAQWQSGAWQPLAEGDAADARVKDLLGSSLPGRGATQPAHWGFLGFLWARQGEVVEWPALDGDDLGQKIRHRLAQVEIDPVMEKLRGRLDALAGEILTASGQPKAHGPLKRAEDDLATIERDLAQIARVREQLDTLQKQFHTAGTEVALLEKEAATARQLAEELTRDAAAAELQQREVERHQAALTHAREALQAVVREVEWLETLRKNLIAAEAGIASATTATTSAGQAQHLAEQRVESARQQRTGREADTARLRAESQRTTNLLKLRQLASEAAALARQLAHAEEFSRQLDTLRQRAAALPEVTAANLAQLEKLASTQHDLTRQVQALGLTVELTAEQAGEVEITRGGVTETAALTPAVPEKLQSPDALDLHLPGWGRIRIHSGAHEAREVTVELAGVEKKLQAALLTAQVASLDAARAAVQGRAEIEAQTKLAEATLDARLGDFSSVETLRVTAATARKRADALHATVQPTAAEDALSHAALEATDERLTTALQAAERGLKALEKDHATQLAAERAAAQQAQQCRAQAQTLQSQKLTLLAQLADLTSRFPTGLEAAKTLGQTAFTEAEARAAAATRGLPPDFLLLPERNRRAAAALQQITDDLQARRATHDSARGALESLGGQGLYSRETELLEQHAEATLRRDAARTKGWAARMTHDLIDYRKQAATKAVLAPLEQRLSAALAEITGDPERQVFLDDRLHIAGLGRTRAEAHAFVLLSQGAKEQLLLCLRLAVAQELATTEPQVLILDDSMVNTDPSRQQRVLDLLARFGESLQIIILTCHPERYRGLGTALAIEKARVNGDW